MDSFTGSYPKTPILPSASNAAKAAATNASFPSVTSAEQARKKWRSQGTNASQILEDRRSKLLQSTVSSLSTGNYSVRIITSESRTDPAGAEYTVYLISVDTYRERTIVEHRYSEFATLCWKLSTNGIRLRSDFPKRHWAGRIGDWTPSTTWAPEKRKELIRIREAKLDVWLVELCEALQIPGYIKGDLRNHLVKFLTLSSAKIPPCDRENFVPWDDLVQFNNSSTNNEESSEITGKQLTGSQKYIPNPISFTLGSSIRQATYTVMQMCGTKCTFKGFREDQSDQTIPLDLLHHARGLCFMTVIKGGFMLSMRGGTGLIMARRRDGSWSPPSAIGTMGMGWGALIGGDITNYLIVLNTEKAIRTFAQRSGTVNLGAELGVAVGPVGRRAIGNLNARADGGGIVPAYAYAHSKGLFAGISFEGSIVKSRPEVNAKFYGRPIDASELLFGHSQEKPKAAQPLYDALNEAMQLKVPDKGFRPSQIFDSINQNNDWYE